MFKVGDTVAFYYNSHILPRTMWENPNCPKWYRAGAFGVILSVKSGIYKVSDIDSHLTRLVTTEDIIQQVS